MDEIRICPECDGEIVADAPLGLCPVCLISMAIEETQEDLTPQGDLVEPGPGDLWLPPTEVISHFSPDPLPGQVSSLIAEWVHPQGNETGVFSRYDSESGDLPPSASSEPFSEGGGPPGYIVLDKLGQGGMGVVYKAKQANLNRFVALKMIRGGTELQDGHLQRFRIEAEALARLRHPNVVQIFEVGEVAGRPFFSLELLEGGSLADRTGGSPQPARFCVELMITLGQAVQAAHEAGVIHRDLKPGNVLFSEDGVPKITDFGLAKRLDVESGLTVTMEVMGTPNYMAPEQALGQHREIGPATDVYALGAILYTLLTGRPPLQGTSWRESLKMVTEDDPLPPSQLQARIPRDLETICLKCLHKAPLRRYASAKEFADDLSRYAEGRPILARRTPFWERGLKWSRRHPVTTTLTTLALAGSICSVAFITNSRIEARFLAIREANRLSQVRTAAFDALFRADDYLARGNLEQSRLVLTKLETILKPEQQLRELLSSTTGKLEIVDSRLGIQEQSRADRVRFERFTDLVDEALLQDTMAIGFGQSGNIDTTRLSAQAALELHGGLGEGDSGGMLTASEQEQLRADRYMLHIVLASAMARVQPGENLIEQAQKGLAILDRASTLRPGSRAYHIARANCLESAADLAGASRERDLAEQLEPSSAFEHFLVGRELHQAGDLPAALRHFDMALREKPDLFWARCLSAIDLLNSNKPGEAKANLTACIQQKPYPWLHLLRGSAFGEIGTAAGDTITAAAAYDAAEADFQKAFEIGLNPRFLYALHMNRGVLRFKIGRFDDAVTDFERAVDLEPSKDQPLSMLAKALDRAGRQGEALTRLDQAIQLQPGLSSHYFDRSLLRGQSNDPAAARLMLADLDEAIRREPARSQAAALYMSRKAHLLLVLGRYLEALAAADDALEIADLVEAHRDRIHALLALRRFDEIITSCDTALEKGRPTAELHELRGLAHIARKDFPAGINDYTLALSLEPDRTRVLVLRGQAYLLFNALKLALIDFERVCELDPRNPDGHAGRGMALAQLLRVRDAVAEADLTLLLGEPDSTRLYASARIYAMAYSIIASQASNRGREFATDAYRYESQAAKLLDLAIERIPADKRASFVREVVESDPFMVPIRRRARSPITSAL